MKKVLVVDDSALARSVVRAAVRAAVPDCDVTEAGDGMVALKLVTVQSFDAMVCDLNMPVLDGQGLLLRMRGLARKTRLPVIILSSLVTDALAVQLRAAGADVVLKKPFTAGQIRDSLRRVGVAA